MGKGIKLFRALGITISLDYSWFIVLVIFTWSLAYGYFPIHLPGLGSGTYLVIGLVSAVLLFVCVLIHELSHSYTSNRLGLRVDEITLFIFGGVAKLTREPDDAVTELKIALAGPAASAVLAAAFWTINNVILGGAGEDSIVSAVLGFLTTINVMLLVFNMIPGLPLDGGRVLRAIWWARTGNVEGGTRFASRVGKGFALFLIIIGFTQILAGNFVGGLWAVIIGVFLQQAAEGSYQQMILKKTLEGVTVADVMTRGVITVERWYTLAEVVDKYFFNYHYVSFPVMDHGRVVGLLTLNHVRAVEKERWNDVVVGDVMDNLTEEGTAHPSDPILELLPRMTTDDIGRFPVVDRGELVGILTRKDIMKALEFKTELKG